MDFDKKKNLNDSIQLDNNRWGGTIRVRQVKNGWKKRFIFEKSKGMNNLAHILVRKSGPLKGNVKISGAKNAVLPVIAATLLADGVSTIKGVPDLRDVHVMSDLLRHLGAKVEFKDETLVVDATNINSYDAPYELVSKMRASFLIMGPLLAR